MRNIPRSSLVVIVLATAFALAACAPAGSGHPSTASTLAPTHATPKHSHKAVPILPAWNGDCTRFFTDAESKGVTALDSVLQPVTGYLYAEDAITALSGGHECAYSDGEDTEHVVASFFPATLPGAAASAAHCSLANTGQVQFEDVCSAAAVAHGFWLTLDFSPGASLTYPQAFAGINTFIADFTSKSAAYAPPVASAALAGTWTKGETCATLGAHSAAASAIGYPAFAVADYGEFSGNWPGFLAAVTATGSLACQWGSDSGLAPAGKLTGFDVVLVPGAGQLNSAAAPANGTVVSIPGTSNAWDVVYNGDNLTYVYASTGPNYLEFQPFGNTVLSLASVQPAITKIIATMNAGG